MIPKRIQLKRTRGWRLPKNTVVVSRPSRWGNPYRIDKDGTAAECVDKFETFLRIHPFVFDIFCRPLKGKNLACWCKPDSPCHADVLIKFANEPRHKNTGARRG